MLKVTGKLLSVPADNYTNKDGQIVAQNQLIIMDNGDIDTTKVQLNSRQVKSGVVDGWTKLIGKEVTLEVFIFSFNNGGYKLNAVGSGHAPFEHASSLSSTKTA